METEKNSDTGHHPDRHRNYTGNHQLHGYRLNQPYTRISPPHGKHLPPGADFFLTHQKHIRSFRMRKK